MRQTNRLTSRLWKHTVTSSEFENPIWFEHRLLKAPDIDGNLHVFSRGCPEIDRMLMFRDWLRLHADDRDLYEAIKHELAARTWKYVQNYADAKSEVVDDILSRARRMR